MKKKDNLVHVRFDYNEAVESKRDLLSLEVDLLKIMKTIERYKVLRINELKLKAKLKRKVGGTFTAINQLQRALPKVEVPKILKHKTPHESSENLHKHDEKIEDELKQIQEKLKNLKFE